MAYAEDFENLERANAQIDIWIDEEQYDKVSDACKIKPEFKGVLYKAFSNPICTKNKDDQWIAILNLDHSSSPVSAILNIPSIDQPIDLTSDEYAAWSRFFWAKLIRAKIQQRGTDCYFRRLDQVVAYLERHCPIILPSGQNPNRKNGGNDKECTRNELVTLKNKLAVIYLLEMAASGEGADQRSFAERARRIMRENQRYIRDESFQWFYDLLARYNIGVGYFHERLYRKAVLEFNYIIKEFLGLEGNSVREAKGDTLKNKEKEKFSQSRLGEALLYSTAVLYRAEVQLKLQLAYHARKTLNTYLKRPSQYKIARKLLATAEAYQQMNNWVDLYETFDEIATRLEVNLGPSSQIMKNLDRSKGKYRNCMGKLRSLLASYYLQFLLTDGEAATPSEKGKLGEYLVCMRCFLRAYKKSCEYQQTEREGYLEQIAEYLAWLVQKGDQKDKALNNNKSGNSIFWEEAKEIYSENSEMLDFDEKRIRNYSCFCKDKRIDLWRLSSESYDAFTKNMREFFKLIVPKEYVKPKDRNQFLQLLERIEKEGLANLNWRQRELKLESGDNHPKDWCESCFPSASKTYRFAGLLSCAQKCNKDNNKSLYAADYEQIMDNWDEHFLGHMKDPSYHDPRCRALHFLGLQRWNSTSPAQGRSLGGGYLLYHTDKDGRVDLGVAIDPGFDFVRNLFHVGFSLADIDLVLLSHAHVDHVRDFESMVTLLLELRKRTKYTDKEIKRKLHAIMTLGVYRRLEYIMESPGLREFVEPYILDIEKEIDLTFLDNKKQCQFEFVKIGYSRDRSSVSSKTNKATRFVPLLPGENGQQLLHNGTIRVTITPTKAYHNDFSEYSDSFGFIINIEDSEEPSIEHRFGYTGDTSWCHDIVGEYSAEKLCNTLLVHLGSLIDREQPERRKFSYYKKKNAENPCFHLIRSKNHPYLMGMLHFLTEVWKTKKVDNEPLVLMSEFGEELRGRIRLDFIDRLKGTYGLNILPVDVGLDVLLACVSSDKCKDTAILKEKDNNPKVWCLQCRHFVALDEADFIHYGHDEALFCVCKTCKKGTPDNVLQERLRVLYEVGRRLQIH